MAKKSYINTLVTYLVEKGSEIKVQFPEVVTYYRESYSLEKIAKGLLETSGDDITRLFGDQPNVGTVSNAIKYALVGNDDPRQGRLYDGLMSRAEYEVISHVHKHSHGAKSQVKAKIGLFAKTHEELAAQARTAAIARGKSPWDAEEQEYLQYLMKGNSFKSRTGYDSQRLADQLNLVFHLSKEVRTCQAVREKIRKLAKQTTVD